MKKKKVWVLAAVAVLTISSTGWNGLLGFTPEDQQQRRETWGRSLVGLQAVEVQVIGLRHDVFAPEGLTNTRIEREIELMLQQAGIKTVSKPRKNVPMLLVQVSVVMSSDDWMPFSESPACHLGTVDFSLFEMVSPHRNPQINCLAITWQETRPFLLGGRELAKYWRRELQRLSPQELRELGMSAREIKQLLSQSERFGTSDIRKDIRRVANGFINDYLAANPKEQPATKD